MEHKNATSRPTATDVKNAIRKQQEETREKIRCNVDQMAYTTKNIQPFN